MAPPEPPRALPRINDRIRLKSRSPIYILDFGSRGETLRNVSPASRRHLQLFDETGTAAEPSIVYVVNDVEVEQLSTPTCDSSGSRSSSRRNDCG